MSPGKKKGLIQNKYVYFQTLFSYPKYNKVFLQLTLKILVNQENSKSNKIIKMTRAFPPYLTFTGEPPGSLKSVSVLVTWVHCLQKGVLWYACFGYAKILIEIKKGNTNL